MRIKYFASLRQKRGLSEEDIVFPKDIQTALQAVEWLKNKDELYRFVFIDEKRICLAIDQELKNLHSSIEGAGEIAFFPPITGG